MGSIATQFILQQVRDSFQEGIQIDCDTALVYGYAEQMPRISAQLVEDVARDKQQSKIVPLRTQAHEVDGDANSQAWGLTAVEKNRSNSSSSKRAMRVVIASDSERQRNFLKMMLERSGLMVTAAVPIGEEIIAQLAQGQADVLLMDLDEGAYRSHDLNILIDQIQGQCRIPVLFNDSSSASAGGGISDLGRKLTLKLTSLIGRG